MKNNKNLIRASQYTSSALYTYTHQYTLKTYRLSLLAMKNHASFAAYVSRIATIEFIFKLCMKVVRKIIKVCA